MGRWSFANWMSGSRIVSSCRTKAVRSNDAAFMKEQPGFVSAQLHRGTAGSSTFVNVAEWESARALGAAFSSPEFQDRIMRYPAGAVATPHVFEKVAIPGICSGRSW